MRDLSLAKPKGGSNFLETSLPIRVLSKGSDAKQSIADYQFSVTDPTSRLPVITESR